MIKVMAGINHKKLNALLLKTSLVLVNSRAKNKNQTGIVAIPTKHRAVSALFASRVGVASSKAAPKHQIAIERSNPERDGDSSDFLLSQR